MARTIEYRITYFFSQLPKNNIFCYDLYYGSKTVENFKDLKQAQKFLKSLNRMGSTKSLFLHYNFEEIKAVMLESRGRITLEGNPRL